MGDARSGGAGSCGSMDTDHVQNSRQAPWQVEVEKWPIYAFMQTLHNQELSWSLKKIAV